MLPLIIVLINDYLKNLQTLSEYINRHLHKRVQYSRIFFNVCISILSDFSWISWDNGPMYSFFKSKSFWMKIRSQAWWLHVLENYDDEDWIENFRVTRETFLFICNKLREKLQPEEIVIENLKSREPVSVEKKVAMTLYFLSSCIEYRVVGNAFGVAKSTVCKHIHDVIYAINEILLPEYIQMPNLDECLEISDYFENKSGISMIIAAVDGSHVPILPPRDGYRDFVNRKGWPSLVLQAVVDHKYRYDQNIILICYVMSFLSINQKNFYNKITGSGILIAQVQGQAMMHMYLRIQIYISIINT